MNLGSFSVDMSLSLVIEPIDASGEAKYRDVFSVELNGADSEEEALLGAMEQLTARLHHIRQVSEDRAKLAQAQAAKMASEVQLYGEDIWPTSRKVDVNTTEGMAAQ